MRARSAIADAMKPAGEAKYDTSLEMLRAARSRAYGRYAQEVEFRIGQLELQKKYALPGGVSPEGRAIDLEAVPEVAGSGKLLLDVAVANAGDKPIVLQRMAFYLVGSAGIVPAVEHSAGSVDGVVVAPGGTGKGVVAFRKLPGSPLGLISPEVIKPQTLVYNDGTRYTSTQFLLMGAGGGPLGGGAPMP